MNVNELINRVSAILNDLWASVLKFLEAIKIKQFDQEKTAKDQIFGE